MPDSTWVTHTDIPGIRAVSPGTMRNKTKISYEETVSLRIGE